MMADSTDNIPNDSKEKNERSRYSVEMKAFAKMLFLITDKNTNERQYTHHEIRAKLHEQFGDSPSRVTIGNWAKEWEGELALRTSIIDGDTSPIGLDTKLIDRDKVGRAVTDAIRMSVISHSRRMQKYSDLENVHISSLLEAQLPSAQLKLLKSLLKENPDAQRINRIISNFKLADIQRGVIDSNKAFLKNLQALEKWMILEEGGRTIVETTSTDIWEYEPVDIEEFLAGDEFLGKSIYESLFDCVKADLKEIFYGNPRKILERRRYKEVMFKEAYGTGKSVRAALIACYLTYLILCLKNPAKYFKLMRGSKITITNVAVTKTQAKDVVYFKLKGIIDNCPWFRNNGYMYDPNNKLELRFDASDSAKTDPNRLYKNVYITSGSSSEFSAVGYDVICGIIDEATAYGEEGGKDKAETIYDTFQGRVASRFPHAGMIVMAGNPHHVDDFLERRLKDAENDKEVYIVKQRSLWEAKMPDYEGDWFYFDKDSMKVVDEAERDKESVFPVPVIFQEKFEIAPEKSTRNLAGFSLESISRFITNVDKIDEMFETSGRRNKVEVITIDEMEKLIAKDPSYAEYIVDLQDGIYCVKFDKDFKPINDGFHAVHVDIGVTGDACGIALGHISDLEKGNPVFYVDCYIRIQGSKSNPNILEGMRSVIYKLSELGFNIGPVSLDGYQSTDFIQIVQRKGYDSYLLSVDLKMTPYINMRQALYEGRINSPCHDFLRHELRTLENVNDKKVDHPLKGSKDVSDALCGMINSLIEKVPIESISSDKDSSEDEAPEEEEKKVVRTPEEIFNSQMNDIGANYGDA